MDELLKDGLDRIEARLARQGGIIQGGTRQIGRLRGKPGDGGDPRKTTP
jgi:hypothetical protein